MSEHYDFHYQPTGSGAISGQQVLQQTEDAINELGDYVNDNVGGAMDVAQQALETAQNAEQDAQTALDTANSFSSAIQSAQQDANTALSTAQTAQTTATNANNTAIQAQQDASSAVTTANNASGQVSTLSGTVTALGQRVTTAEGNIGQNTSDITALTTRVGTAEGNITTLQNDVSIAQGNASSAMATAGQVKQQAYVLRYSSSSVTDNSTIAYSTLDNTDNIKASDKIIDSDGKIFSIVSVDTVNQTVTVGTALIDLALDTNVVHTSGNETITGAKYFTVSPQIYNSDSTASEPNLIFKNSKYAIGDTTDTGEQRIIYADKNGAWTGSISSSKNIAGTQYLTFTIYSTDNNNANISSTINYYLAKNGDRYFTSYEDNLINLGSTTRRWKSIYATNYYYGSNNVEFSTKFVTTDTNQTISGNKTFSSDLSISNTDTTANTPNLNLRNYKADRGTTDTAVQSIGFLDKNGKALTSIESRRISNGNTATNILCYNTDDSNNTVSGGIAIIKGKNDTSFAPNTDNAVNCGRALAKWSDVVTYKVNGLNPSSLSLPSDRSARIDISSYITNLGNGNTNSYTVPANGYIWLNFTSVTGIICYSQTSSTMTNYAQTFTRSQGDGQLYAFFPVRNDDRFVVQIYTSSTAVVQNAYFIPCQGNI